MAVPDFQTIMRPLLARHADGEEHEIGATRSALADEFSLSEVDRAERIPSGRVTTLQNRVKEEDWEFFERLVLKVLRAMGYGGPEGAIERLGGHGSDGGVDGVIREDTLGLELIYIQVKAWQDKTVGRPDIQQFIGALHGRQASKGIFITTSKFSPEAKNYAEGVSSRVILIDGPRLAELMIDHGVGVTTREIYELKEVDLSYFSPEEVR